MIQFHIELGFYNLMHSLPKDAYGYRRITEGLKIEYGVIYNHKKVARIMKKILFKAEYIKRINKKILIP